MRKCQIILISIVSLLIIAVSSCKTTDTLAKRETEVEKKQKSEFFQKIMAQYPQFSTMSSKCNLSIANISSKAQIKMIKDDYIQISLQPILGIEMLRIMLTRDTLYVVDKINSQVAIEPLSSITETLSANGGISEVQNMILGLPFALGNNIIASDYNEFEWSYEQEGVKMKSDVVQKISSIFSYDVNAHLLSTIIEYDYLPAVECQYSEYKKDENGIERPSVLTLQSRTSKFPINETIKITNFAPEWDKKVVKDTKISSRYKRVTLKGLLEQYM